MHPLKMLRLFLALPVPPDARIRLETFQRQLQRRAPPGIIHWAQPRQFHITLNFLGAVSEEQLTMLEDAVFKICAAFPAIQISANLLGYFPKAEHPRVIWVGVTDEDGQLNRLHNLLQGAILPFISPTKEESFSSHITLGRITGRSNAAMKEFLKVTNSLPADHFGDWQAPAVKIMRSDLSPTGAHHTLLLSCPLAG
jgi:2'-5' RNA ligase